MRKLSKRVTITLLSIVAFIAIVWIALPFVVLHFANKALAEMDGYRGRINDIDIALIRGAYKIDSIYLNKVDSATGKETPFFSASTIDLSVEWKALFRGSVVGELEFLRPRLEFVKDKVEPETLEKDSTDFRKLLKDLMPLQVNRFEIRDGNLRYRDETSTPKVDIGLTDLDVVALNLRNSYDSSALLPASVTASANVYEGQLTVNLKLNPLAEQATFDMNAELVNTNLVLLNEFFKAYAKIDVNKGTFGLYAEVAAKDGGFNGYVKPLMKDLDVLGLEDKEDNFFRKIWEAIAGGGGEVFENQPRDQVATKIPFRGRLDNPRANIWITVANTLRNAFISAIQPSIDNEINIASVDAPKEEKKTLIQRVLGNDDKQTSRNDKPSRKERREARKKKRAEKKDGG